MSASLVYFFQLQLDRITKLLNPKTSHTSGPRKPSLSQQEDGSGR